MQIEDSRNVPNSFEDYVPEKTDFSRLYTSLALLFRESLSEFDKRVKATEPVSICSIKSKSTYSYSIFDGAGGNLYLYLNLYGTCCILSEDEAKKAQFRLYFKDLDDVSFCAMLDAKKYLKNAEDCFYAIQELIEEEKLLKSKTKLRISFYFGGVGAYTLGASLFYELNDRKNFLNCIERVLEIKSVIMKSPRLHFYDELLYGVSGYLFCLLSLQKSFQFENVNQEFRINFEKEVVELMKEIIDRGISNFDKKLSFEIVKKSKLSEDFRLVYTFHEKAYIGGAHGFFGVLHILLEAYSLNKKYLETSHQEFNDIFHQLVVRSIVYYVNLQFDSGNFPSSFSRLKKDELVQFCHGSPGAIPSLILASNLYSADQEFGNLIKKSLEKACDNIWKCGLLKKGYGLCHGISGNAYGMLNYFNFTQNPKWLYRSLIFALGKNNEKLMKELENYEFDDRYVVGKSDNPYSLMLGLSGDLMLILHLFFPEKTK